MTEVERLCAENTRLREALRTIPYYVYCEALRSGPGDHEYAWHWFTVAAHEHIMAALGESFRAEDGGIERKEGAGGK